MKRYRDLAQSLDGKCLSLTVLYEKHLTCHEGCSGCCQHHLSVFGVEADTLRPAIATLAPELRRTVREQAATVLARESAGESVACPLLVDNRCAVYEARPIICRTHGLPLVYEAKDGSAEVDWCPLNFTSPDAVDDLREDGLLNIDEINFELAASEIERARTSGRTPEQSRFKLADLVLETAIDP
jgi:uncharacterized protein